MRQASRLSYFLKINKEKIYWGVIDKIQNDNGSTVYQYTLRYITNLFDQDILLENEYLIKTKGIEDFVANSVMIKGKLENTFIYFS